MADLLNNRYRILKPLGSGGCGQTFLAEDEYTFNSKCVVKQFKPTTTDPEAYQIIKERFQREAAILKTLGEHNKQIPSLFAYFIENHEFYLVQEWIEGLNLLQKVRSAGTLGEIGVQRFLLGLLPVLSYVHSQGIIHRDIKPENVMLHVKDSKLVLIDFGAVKEVVTTVVNGEGVPTSSIVIGSPGYMPLEQSAGRPIFASDIFSLGLTAIYLLTGKNPQELRNLQTGEIAWQEYARGVSSDFALIIDKAIQQMPHNRYQQAIDMQTALERISSENRDPAKIYSEITRLAQPPSPTPASSGNNSTPKTIQNSKTPAVSPANGQALPQHKTSKGYFWQMATVTVGLVLILFLSAWGLRNPLFRSATSGENRQLASFFLSLGADVNSRDTDGNTALHYAAKNYGDSGDVNWLLNRGADATAKNDDGDTPLILAAGAGSKNKVKIFLDRDVDVNVKNNKGETALLKVSKRYGDFTHTTTNSNSNIAANANLPANSNSNSNRKTEELDGMKIFRMLLEKGANVNVADNDGMTTLMYVADKYTVAMDLLIQKGANVNARNSNGKTALGLTKEKMKDASEENKKFYNYVVQILQSARATE